MGMASFDMKMGTSTEGNLSRIKGADRESACSWMGRPTSGSGKMISSMGQGRISQKTDMLLKGITVLQLLRNHSKCDQTLT